VKGNQSEDTTRKGALRAAAGFLGVSILFATLALISGLVLASTKGCTKKKTKWVFILAVILLAICYIIALVIIYVYQRRDEIAGNTAAARDLRSSFVMPLVAIGLYTLAFVLLYLALGSKLKKLKKACKQFERVKQN
jgi:arginine exporter protein ArgO